MFWNVATDKKITELQSQYEGVSSEEASRRLKQYGPNKLKVVPQQKLRQFFSRFKNPLVLILLGASFVSAATGDFAGSSLIALMILLSVTLDYVQQYRAEEAAEKLKKIVSVLATVMRDNKPHEIPFSEVVPGDVVLLTAGDLVPADGLLLEAKDLFLNQAVLTGESYPVEKTVLTNPGSGIEITDALNAVFMGSSVISGSGRVLICNTGANTFLGDIAESLGKKAPPTAFETGIHRFGVLIMRLTVSLVLFVLLINTLFHRPWLESFLFAIALAVGLTPELLPMIVTVTLSRGSLRMAKKDVIVKKLESIQNLGSMDTLCSDKTGTLTEGKIYLERHVDIYGNDSEKVLMLAYLNSFFETGLRSPIDQAIIEHKSIDISLWKKIDEVPFDFERRRVSILVENEKRRLLVVKGSLDELLLLSDQSGINDESDLRTLDGSQRRQIQDLRNSLEEEGFRTIGIAWKEVPRDHEHVAVSDERNLVFAGIAAFQDPPKKGVEQVLRSVSESGVQLKLVTGDGELVSRHLLKAISMEVTGALSGAEIQEMDDPALQARVEDVNLFYRVSPIQKNRIILALKKRGHTVGYMGDGINDAPSLHSADVGISVQGAVDVAKDAAEIILMKNDLNVLVEGIQEGRRTHVNVMKYIMMGTSSNFGNMFSMAGATLILPFLPMLPLQILLNNFLYDISEITIPTDRVDEISIQKPSRWDIQFIHRFMWVIGLVSSLFDFLTFYVLIVIFKADETLFHTGWFVESIATQVLVIFVIRTRYKFWKSRPSWPLVLSSLFVVFLAALLPHTPFAEALGFSTLSPAFFGVLLLLVVCYLLFAEVIKEMFYRFFLRKQS